MQIIALNSKLKYNYEIIDNFECGICLLGSEIKSLRNRNVSIQSAYATVEKEELYVYNLSISEYEYSSYFSHSPLRKKKLLAHKKQILKMMGFIKIPSHTLVVISIYLNDKNVAKVNLGLARGKSKFDKRRSIMEKAWRRNKLTY